MLGFIIPAGILCGLFALFTAVMFCDQIKMITEDTSTIDKKLAQRQIEEADLGKQGESKKLNGGVDRPFLEAFKEVFGASALTWPIPMNIGVDLSVEN